MKRKDFLKSLVAVPALAGIAIGVTETWYEARERESLKSLEGGMLTWFGGTYPPPKTFSFPSSPTISLNGGKDWGREAKRIEDTYG